MKRLLAFLAFVVLYAAPAMAQPHVEVQADRVLIGTEFVPRFLNLPDKLLVGAGPARHVTA